MGRQFSYAYRDDAPKLIDDKLCYDYSDDINYEDLSYISKYNEYIDFMCNRVFTKNELLVKIRQLSNHDDILINQSIIDALCAFTTVLKDMCCQYAIINFC